MALISVGDDDYDDLQVLKELNGIMTDETLIRYLITCYGVYCHQLGLPYYEVLREHRRQRWGEVKTHE